MKDISSRSRWLVGLVTEFVAVAAAASYVATHDGFGRGDLIAMATWSLPLALATAWAMTIVSRRIVARGMATTFVVLAVVGALVGALWSLVAALVLGPWIAAFSFPVLSCWIAGGLLGGITAAGLLRLRAWPVTAIAVILVILGVQRVNTYRPAPEPAIRIVLRPAATHADVDSVWTTVLGHRTGRGDEHYLLPSLSSVGGASAEGSSPVLVATFWRGTSQRTRDSVVAEIRRSPFVLRVDMVATP